MKRNLYSTHIRYTQRQFESGLAAGRDGAGNFQLQFCRADRTGMELALVQQLWEKVAIARRSADVYKESCKISAEDRRSQCADAERFIASADLRTTDTKMRCTNGRERGLKSCR
jgi:hypothetical protein